MKERKDFRYYLIVFLFTTLIVACFPQVLFRSAFNLPLAWTEELSGYVFIILIYCGVNTAVLNSAHVGVELIGSALSEHGRSALDIAVELLCVAVGLIIAYDPKQIIHNTSLSKQLSVSFRILTVGLRVLAAVMPCLIAFRFLQTVFKMIVREKEVETKS